MAMIRVSDEARRWLNDKAYEQREPVSIVVDRMIWTVHNEKLRKPVDKPKSEAKPTSKKKVRVRVKPECSICGKAINKSKDTYGKDNIGRLTCGDCMESGKARDRYLQEHGES